MTTLKTITFSKVPFEQSLEPLMKLRDFSDIKVQFSGAKYILTGSEMDINALNSYLGTIYNSVVTLVKEINEQLREK